MWSFVAPISRKCAAIVSPAAGLWPPSSQSGVSVLMAQHREGERGVHSLMRAGQAGQGGLHLAALVAIMEPALIDRSIPGFAPRQHRRTCRLCDLGNPRGERCAIVHGDERYAGLGDAGLLAGDLRERVAQERFVVDAELGDAADGRVRDRTLVASSRPPRPTSMMQASAGCGKGEEGGGGRDLEEARADIAAGIEHFGEQRRELGIVDQRAGDADTLVEADQMRAGVDMRGRSPAASIAARRKAQVDPLPLVPATWSTGGSAILRIAEPVEQG
jgi:hypothetical protein